MEKERKKERKKKREDSFLYVSPLRDNWKYVGFGGISWKKRYLVRKVSKRGVIHRGFGHRWLKKRMAEDA